MIEIKEYKHNGKLHHFDGYWLDLGSQQVWSEKKGNRWLKPWRSRDGYIHVQLRDVNGKQLTSIKLSRLVWTVANGRQIPDGMDVNHIDEDKSNNHPSNLNLMTRKENLNHGTHNARMAAALTNGKTSRAVAKLTLDGKLIATWPSTREAHRNGWYHSAVSRCCNKCYNGTAPDIYKGYRWMWLDEYEKQQTPTTTDGQLEFAFAV